MGTLVLKHYPTSLFANAADHTYVECGTGGKAWSCWGGQTGGAVLRQATGSTKRADAIAEPNERAGITCYLINGVCHQAANRILISAGITVNGARGYHISQALFGPYGRVGFWPCRAPFDQHAGITGDIPECAPPPGPAASDLRLSAVDQLDWNYIRGAVAIYESYAGLLDDAIRPDTEGLAALPPEGPHVDFQMALFEHMLDFHVGSLLADDQTPGLLAVRRRFELQRIELEARYARDEIPAPEFVDAFNRLTIEFQEQIGKEMTDAQYESLFQLRKDERVVLADPEIASRELGS